MKISLKSPLSRGAVRRQAREYAAEGRILDVMLDIVFKTLFTADDEDSRESRRLLLSDCTHRAVRNVRVQNNEILPEYLTGKTIRLDIRVTFNDGEQADLEMQIQKSDDDLKARALLLGAKLLAGQMNRGVKYGETKRVNQIFFLNCVLFSGSEKVPRRYFVMEEDEHDRLSQNLEIIFYEMPKLERVVRAYVEGRGDLENLSKEQKWCIFFRYKNEEKMGRMIEELCKQEEGIMRADRALAKISRDEQKWARAFSREVGIIDHESGLYAAGEVRAEQIARKMKADSLSPEKIREYTGLSSEEIERL
jgi:predicted transposase/invertase (TIGR01784 family)